MNEEGGVTAGQPDAGLDSAPGTPAGAGPLRAALEIQSRVAVSNCQMRSYHVTGLPRGPDAGDMETEVKRDGGGSATAFRDDSKGMPDNVGPSGHGATGSYTGTGRT